MPTVLFVSNKDSNLYSFRKEVILSFQDKGYEVILVCPQGPRIEYFIENGCHFEDLSIDRRGENPFKDLVWMRQFRKILNKCKPDVVCTYTTKVSIYAGLVCRFSGVKYIINNSGLLQIHNPLLKGFLHILYKLAFSKAVCMMCQNKNELDFFKSVLGDRMKYNLLPGSGVNVEAFNYCNYPTEESPLIFNYVGRIEKDKGIEEFLNCASVIKKETPSAKFRIFGDFDDELYKEKVADLERDEIIEYMGRKQDLKPFIAESHAIIHPSYHEGMANVILEHAAMGRPALASDIPGCREPIDNGVSGYTFKVKDTDDMIIKVRLFISLSHEEKADMGHKARIKIEKQFDRNIIVNKYTEEISRL